MKKNNQKILIVDDEISLATALKIKLEKVGYKTITATNGKEGLSLAIQEKPDLILLDIIMPIMDGLTMLRKLREEGQDTKVIMLTNLSDPKSELIAEANGVTTFLVKSDWKLEELINQIETILEQ